MALLLLDMNKCRKHILGSQGETIYNKRRFFFETHVQSSSRSVHILPLASLPILLDGQVVGEILVCDAIPGKVLCIKVPLVFVASSITSAQEIVVVIIFPTHSEPWLRATSGRVRLTELWIVAVATLANVQRLVVFVEALGGGFCGHGGIPRFTKILPLAVCGFCVSLTCMLQLGIAEIDGPLRDEEIRPPDLDLSFTACEVKVWSMRRWDRGDDDCDGDIARRSEKGGGKRTRDMRSNDGCRNEEELNVEHDGVEFEFGSVGLQADPFR